LVQSVFAARRTLGLPERCGSGSTDANAAAALGIPAVAIGCGDGSGMHTLHERIDLPSLDLGCRQLAAIIRGV
jgi:acetylornithine deacetylase/succinyl-diaminopimelate desuccinylase-like protein